MKIVESIVLNVVNSGYNLAPLPDEVAGLCVHIASAATFAVVVTEFITVRMTFLYIATASAAIYFYG